VHRIKVLVFVAPRASTPVVFMPVPSLQSQSAAASFLFLQPVERTGPSSFSSDFFHTCRQSTIFFATTDLLDFSFSVAARVDSGSFCRRQFSVLLSAYDSPSGARHRFYVRARLISSFDRARIFQLLHPSGFDFCKWKLVLFLSRQI
jgi:hypothetical protein